MSIFEYDEEKVRRVLRKEAIEEGYEEGYEEGKSDGRAAGMKEGKIEGKIEDILYFLREKGTVSKELEKRIGEQKDETILRKWLRLASNTESIEEFQMRL